jgi:hypothetical protein
MVRITRLTLTGIPWVNWCVRVKRAGAYISRFTLLFPTLSISPVPIPISVMELLDLPNLILVLVGPSVVPGRILSSGGLLLGVLGLIVRLLIALARLHDLHSSQ